MTAEAVLAWLDEREPRPPAGLSRHVRAAVTAVDLTNVSTLSDALAAAAIAAVDRVTASNDQGRRVAPHLLAADALITYAFEARAADAPERLASWAEQLAEQTGAIA